MGMAMKYIVAPGMVEDDGYWPADGVAPMLSLFSHVSRYVASPRIIRSSSLPEGPCSCLYIRPRSAIDSGSLLPLTMKWSSVLTSMSCKALRSACVMA